MIRLTDAFSSCIAVFLFIYVITRNYASGRARCFFGLGRLVLQFEKLVGSMWLIRTRGRSTNKIARLVGRWQKQNRF